MLKNTFIFATLIIGEIIAFDCVGSYCQQQGKSEEDKWGSRFQNSSLNIKWKSLIYKSGRTIILTHWVSIIRDF